MTTSPRRGRPVGIGLRRGDDTGSLAMALMLTIVALSLSALLIPMVVTQVGSTRHVVARVDALNAAQSGIDVALGQIRAANDGHGNGELGLLPCGPLQGSLDDDTATWWVRIYYLQVDPPQGLNNDELNDWLDGNQMLCNIAAGKGMLTTPRRAILRANGTVGSSMRSLRATYTFQTTNANIPGGQIEVYRSSTGTDLLCLDATDATIGTDLRVELCDPNRRQQKFAYTEELTIVLVSSGSPTLCLEAGEVPHAVGRAVELRACVSPAPLRQRWSANDWANFEGTANGVDRDGFCFNVQQPGSPSPVILGSKDTGTCRQRHDTRQTFLPDKTVGAGAAGPKTGQLVNFQQFGRCLDIPHGGTYAWGEPLIAWPCKQTFQPTNPATLNWNQRWTLPAFTTGASSTTGKITTTNGTSTYCLQGPASATAASQYVILAQTCGTASAMTWTVSRDTGRYETSYRIMNHYGHCLVPTDPATDPYVDRGVVTNAGKIKVAPCTGSTDQKWNAPPDVIKSGPLSDIGEG